MKLLLSLVAIVFVYISNVVAQASSTVSITAAQGYAIQRQCAKCNLWQCAGNVNDFLQCNGLNYCYCRADLSSDVNSLLSSRLSTDCTPGPATNDISLAISIYSQYCAQAMGDVVTTTEALPSGTGSPGTGSPVTSTTIQIETATARSGAQPSLSVTYTYTVPPKVIITLHSTVTSLPAEQSSSGGSTGGGGPSLNGGEIAGIVIGIISAIGTIAGVYLAWKLLKKDRGSDNGDRAVQGF